MNCIFVLCSVPQRVFLLNESEVWRDVDIYVYKCGRAKAV
jgi:hypothetical protein